MGANSKIEWTEATWNPIAGCSIVSPGCHNCYAMRTAARLEAMGQAKYVGTTKKANGKTLWTGKINFDEEALSLPLRTKKPTMWFVNSMSDLFHENVSNEFIAKVFAVMYECQWHTFQILTKRAERLQLLANSRMPWAVATMAHAAMKSRSPEKADYVTVGDIERDVMAAWPLPNVWLGVSAEDQQRADERIPWLLKTPAAVLFLSAEPLLGPIELGHLRRGQDDAFNALDGIGGSNLDWVIVGCESGRHRRPMKLEWAESLASQCSAAGVACFIKQVEVNGKVSGECGQFPEYLQRREFP